MPSGESGEEREPAAGEAAERVRVEIGAGPPNRATGDPAPPVGAKATGLPRRTGRRPREASGSVARADQIDRAEDFVLSEPGLDSGAPFMDSEEVP